MKNKQSGFVGVVIVIVLGFFALLGIFALMDGKTGTNPVKATNEIQTTNEIQKTLVANIPIPQLSTSMERVNVAKRATMFNKEDKISYIYLVDYGKVMAFYTVKGKVSSLNSYMSPTDRIMGGKGEPCKWNDGSCYVVEAPDIDGTYGENVHGIFFFTTEDAYVEWNGNYMMSDQPLKLTTPPELVRTIK